MFDRRQILSAAAAGFASSVLPATAQQQANTVRLVVGFAPGGSADGVARLLASKLSKDGIQYIVDNRAGAGGRIAADFVKAAPPDGKTLLVTPDAVMAIYPHVYKKLGYNPVTDFKAVSLLTSVPIGISVGPMVPASVKTPADFVQWCRANPDKAAYGSAGAGSPLHFLGALFAKANGLQMTHVPFRGGAPAAQGALSGQVAASVNVISETLPLLAPDKLRLLAVTGTSRSRFLPDVPTFGETGLKDAEFLAWFGLFAPARTPDNIVASLRTAAAEAFTAPDSREALSKLSFDVVASTPDQLAATVKSDIARWGPVVRDSGYTADE